MILGSGEEFTLRPALATPASHRHAKVAGLDRRCKSIGGPSPTLPDNGKSTSLLFPTCILHPTWAIPTFGCGPTSHFIIWFSRSAWHIGDFDLRITWGFTEGIDLVFTIAGLVCFYILRRHGPSLPAIRRRVTPPQNLILRSYPRYNWLQALQAIVLGMFASRNTTVVVRSCALLGLSLLSM
jgi:hypothetical protein